MAHPCLLFVLVRTFLVRFSPSRHTRFSSFPRPPMFTTGAQSCERYLPFLSSFLELPQHRACRYPRTSFLAVSFPTKFFFRSVFLQLPTLTFVVHWCLQESGRDSILLRLRAFTKHRPGEEEKAALTLVSRRRGSIGQEIPPSTVLPLSRHQTFPFCSAGGFD